MPGDKSMIVIMKHGATSAQIANIIARVEQMGCQADVSEGDEHTVIGVIGNGRPLDQEQIERMTGVERTVPVAKPFRRASRDFHPQDTVVPINGVSVGGEQVIVMAGPCSVEGEEQVLETAQLVKEAGAHVLRGGAFKPRTSHTVSREWASKGCESWPRRARKLGYPSSPRLWNPRRCRWSLPLPTFSRSVLAICRTMPCCTPSVRRSVRCCSSGA